VAAFVHALKARTVTPHIAIDGHLSPTGTPRSTAIDRRTTRHAGYGISGRCRKRIEEVFGWVKGSAGLAKVKLRGKATTRWSLPAAMVGPNCKKTALSKAKSVSTTATTSPSSRAAQGLLQQPASWGG